MVLFFNFFQVHYFQCISNIQYCSFLCLWFGRLRLSWWKYAKKLARTHLLVQYEKQTQTLFFHICLFTTLKLAAAFKTVVWMYYTHCGLSHNVLDIFIGLILTKLDELVHFLSVLSADQCPENVKKYFCCSYDVCFLKQPGFPKYI